MGLLDYILPSLRCKCVACVARTKDKTVRERHTQTYHPGMQNTFRSSASSHSSFLWQTSRIFHKSLMRSWDTKKRLRHTLRCAKWVFSFICHTEPTLHRQQQLITAIKRIHFLHTALSNSVLPNTSSAP